MAEEKLNLYQKLAKIRDMSNVVKKDKSGYNYKYASLPEILANITAGMKKYGVSLIPMITPQTASVSQNIIPKIKITKTGDRYEDPTAEMVVHADMIYRWVDDENPDDHIDVPWFLTGSQSDPSMAFGGSLTFCTRYFLTTYFNIALVENDVDAYRSKQKEAEKIEETEMVKEIVSQIDSLIKSYLAKHQDQKEAIIDLSKKYIKGGNYYNIKDPQLAANMLNELKDKIESENGGK